MTSPASGPNEFYINLVQSQLDRRFTDLGADLNRRFNEMDRRFTTVDDDIKEIKTKMEKLEEAPKNTYRAYVTPVIVALFTAILLAFLVRAGVTTK